MVDHSRPRSRLDVERSEYTEDSSSNLWGIQAREIIKISTHSVHANESLLYLMSTHKCELLDFTLHSHDDKPHSVATLTSLSLWDTLKRGMPFLTG